MFTPKGVTAFEKAADKVAYQDATLQMAEMAEQGDDEMKKVVLDRVEALTGQRQASIEVAIKAMQEDF